MGGTQRGRGEEIGPVVDTRRMLNELLARRQLRSLYQPLVHRASGDLIGYEALARGPEGHALERPDLLFAAAREAGRLAELDWLCRATAFGGAVAGGLRPPTALFVNVEADVFDAPPPPEHADALRQATRHLKVLYEVTERGLSERPAELLAEVERVRALGFGIAVDDLGTDWRSLALLPLIRPDVVKLDMALIQGPLTDAGRQAQLRRPLMRKIKSNFFISLDGVVESPDKWHFPYFDDEMGAAVSAGFANVDAILMGRVLYDEWAAYWPEHADQPFGDVINSIKKYVVSDSLQAAEWQNSEIVSGDVAQKLTDLKAQDGGDIAMSGSPTTVRWLLREGLLDELNLLVHPIAVGQG